MRRTRSALSECEDERHRVREYEEALTEGASVTKQMSDRPDKSDGFESEDESLDTYGA